MYCPSFQSDSDSNADMPFWLFLPTKLGKMIHSLQSHHFLPLFNPLSIYLSIYIYKLVFSLPHSNSVHQISSPSPPISYLISLSLSPNSSRESFFPLCIHGWFWIPRRFGFKGHIRCVHHRIRVFHCVCFLCKGNHMYSATHVIYLGWLERAFAFVPLHYIQSWFIHRTLELYVFPRPWFTRGWRWSIIVPNPKGGNGI